MRVRRLDSNDDWTFGSGQNCYLVDFFAVCQNLTTRLRSFLGDCFFDNRAGIDWFNLLGSKNILGLNLAVRSVILNTQAIVAIRSASLELRSNRDLHLVYDVQDLYRGTLRGTLGFLVTESGDILTTEDGDGILVESG